MISPLVTDQHLHHCSLQKWGKVCMGVYHQPYFRFSLSAQAFKNYNNLIFHISRLQRMFLFHCLHSPHLFHDASSAILSKRLTRLKPLGPLRAGSHATFFLLLVLNMDTENAPCVSLKLIYRNSL